MDWIPLISLVVLQITGDELEIGLSKQSGFQLKLSFRRKPKQ